MATFAAWGRALKVYVDPKVLRILVLGFGSGLPLLLVYSTLSAWLSEADVSKTMIGLFSWASTAYALKFVWSPLVDRLPIPVLTPLLGQRKSWLVLSQGAVMAAIVGLGGTDPTASLLPTALWAVALAFASATQDIVVDAYRVESLPENEQGAGAANYVLGYRIGMFAAGAGALIIADAAGWFWAYVAMAGLMGVAVVVTLAAPEPDHGRAAASLEREKTLLAGLERTTRLPKGLRPLIAWIGGAVIAPFADFMTRRHWLAILAFVALYKYGDALLGVMANPFYLEMGFSKTEIGVISKGYGLAMTLIGGIIGGLLVARYGILKALLVSGILQAASNLVFALQAWVGYSLPMLSLTISVENLTGGMGTTAFVAYLSSLCNVAYTATQYALLSSLMAFARTILASGGGWLADRLDWVTFFVVTTGAALPGLMMLLWMLKTFPEHRRDLPEDLVDDPD